MNIEDLLKAMPDKLIILEEYFNLNQTQMAEKAGMSRTLYSTIRRGAQTASIDFILKICIAFGVSLDWILYGQGRMLAKENELQNHLTPEAKDLYYQFIEKIMSYPLQRRVKLLKLIDTAVDLLDKEEEKEEK